MYVTISVYILVCPNNGTAECVCHWIFILQFANNTRAISERRYSFIGNAITMNSVSLVDSKTGNDTTTLNQTIICQGDFWHGPITAEAHSKVSRFPRINASRRILVDETWQLKPQVAPIATSSLKKHDISAECGKHLELGKKWWIRTLWWSNQPFQRFFGWWGTHWNDGRPRKNFFVLFVFFGKK